MRGLLPSLCEAVGGVSCGVVAVGGGGWRCWWRRRQRRFFGLSVKGSSMLSIAKECRGGRLLSRHKAWWREGEQMERGGAQEEASRSHFLFFSCCYLRGNVFFLLFRHRKCFLPPPPPPLPLPIENGTVWVCARTCLALVLLALD